MKSNETELLCFHTKTLKKKTLQKTTKETEDNVQEHSQSDDPLMTMLLKNQTII